jgi:pilus assembly protein Flp/PilA
VWKCRFRAADALRDLVARKDGVVSYEYVLVAAAVIGTVAAFGTAAGTGPVKDALTSAMDKVVTKVATATGG